jgi:hypothetical protein
MFPKSPQILAEEQKASAIELDAAFAALWREHELIKAALENDDALAKVAHDSNEVTFAKIEAGLLKARDTSLFLHTGQRIVDWLNERQTRSYEHRLAEKRAERFFGGARK